jgi:curved DNA-binding protein CbpA
MASTYQSEVLLRESPLKLQSHYEFLQISPNAEPDTIHRVYRFLAIRFHPDNAETGNPEKFYLLKQAYDVLSDPERRAAYDAECEQNAPEQPPLSSTIDFMDSMEGELNRRLAVLALLYFRRRSTPDSPEVSLTEVESRMGFPRDYLEFTTWYLQKKGYITRADNSAFTLTATGVDFVETQRARIPILNKLLTSGAELSTRERRCGDQDRRRGEPCLEASPMAGFVPIDRRVRGDRRRREA